MKLDMNEVLGYRTETLSGDCFSLQLFDDDVLVYKTFDYGVRNGIYLKAECYLVSGTTFLKECQDLIEKFCYCTRVMALVDRNLVHEEDLVCRGDVIGSLFLHQSHINYFAKYAIEMTEKDMAAASADFADAFLAAFAKARSSLPKLENCRDTDYIDPFIEKDIYAFSLKPDSSRTLDLSGSLRPCLNSFPLRKVRTYTEARLAGIQNTEDYLNKKLLPLILIQPDQEGIDGQMLGLVLTCQRLSFHCLSGEEDYEAYLDALLLVYAIQGKIKSASTLRWLHPDYTDVIQWHREDPLTFYFFDYADIPLKYYRWKCEKLKLLPIFYFQIWRNSGWVTTPIRG